MRSSYDLLFAALCTNLRLGEVKVQNESLRYLHLTQGTGNWSLLENILQAL
jgi:hypothetical protein